MLNRVKTIAFVARFAPEHPDREPQNNPEWGSSPHYHHRLYHALAATGANVMCLTNPAELSAVAKDIDFVYSIYNRANFRNSEVFVSSLCSFLRLPYLGGHPNSRAIAEDKHLFKMIAQRLDIPTPKWVKIDTWDSLQALEKLDLPCIVKWRFGADSAGITSASVAPDLPTLRALVKDAQAEKTPVIVEEFVPGENITIGVLGTPECEIFDPIKIVTGDPQNIQTYRQKKFNEGHREKSRFEDKVATRRIRSFVAQLYNELQPLDYFRADFRYTPETGALSLLEVNAVCNLHPESTFAMSAYAYYPNYDTLVRRILTISLDRQGLVLE